MRSQLRSALIIMLGGIVLTVSVIALILAALIAPLLITHRWISEQRKNRRKTT